MWLKQGYYQNECDIHRAIKDYGVLMMEYADQNDLSCNIPQIMDIKKIHEFFKHIHTKERALQRILYPTGLEKCDEFDTIKEEDERILNVHQSDPLSTAVAIENEEKDVLSSNETSPHRRNEEMKSEEDMVDETNH
ncbi:hypothetical protein CRE_29092 [Caenorhabditis remanei]|uniref:Uncharacterized protein n=1 Tax=Caenorhabditis remanei TaxID=31234 RepID=E3MWC6_CAERE|nr:hypothetical protein CRE_29092 [Caenorhabditis remanei]